MRTLSMLPTSALPTSALPEGAIVAPLSLNFGANFATQVEEYLRVLGDPRGFTHLALTGQAVGAIITMAALEMMGGLPQLALLPFGAKEIVGWLPTSDFRHNTCRDMREKNPGEVPAGYTVIDGAGRGVTPAQLDELAELLKCGVEEIHVSSTNPGQVAIGDLAGAAGVAIAEGIRDAMKAARFPVGEVQGAQSRLLFIPAGAGIVGTVQGLALHGFTGAWPRTIRLAGTPATGFKVAEICDPQAMRQWGANLARELEATKPVVSLSGEIPAAFREALASLATQYSVEVRG